MLGSAYGYRFNLIQQRLDGKENPDNRTYVDLSWR